MVIDGQQMLRTHVNELFREANGNASVRLSVGPFTYLPPWFQCSNDADMIQKGKHVDNGERADANDGVELGPIALRTDSNTVKQLTGTDSQDVAAWTDHPSWEMVTSLPAPATKTEGDIVFLNAIDGTPNRDTFFKWTRDSVTWVLQSRGVWLQHHGNLRYLNFVRVSLGARLWKGSALRRGDLAQLTNIGGQDLYYSATQGFHSNHRYVVAENIGGNEMKVGIDKLKFVSVVSPDVPLDILLESRIPQMEVFQLADPPHGPLDSGDATFITSIYMPDVDTSSRFKMQARLTVPLFVDDDNPNTVEVNIPQLGYSQQAPITVNNNPFWTHELFIDPGAATWNGRLDIVIQIINESGASWQVDGFIFLSDIHMTWENVIGEAVIVPAIMGGSIDAFEMRIGPTFKGWPGPFSAYKINPAATFIESYLERTSSGISIRNTGGTIPNHTTFITVPPGCVVVAKVPPTNFYTQGEYLTGAGNDSLPKLQPMSQFSNRSALEGINNSNGDSLISTLSSDEQLLKENVSIPVQDFGRFRSLARPAAAAGKRLEADRGLNLVAILPSEQAEVVAPFTLFAFAFHRIVKRNPAVTLLSDPELTIQLQYWDDVFQLVLPLTTAVIPAGRPSSAVQSALDLIFFRPVTLHWQVFAGGLPTDSVNVELIYQPMLTWPPDSGEFGIYGIVPRQNDSIPGKEFPNAEHYNQTLNWITSTNGADIVPVPIQI